MKLDRVSLLSGVRTLARRDRGLARLVARDGPPPLWARRPGFPTLLRIILEQQVSLASADALYNRLARTVRSLDPVGILGLGIPGLQAVGLTRQKAGYVYGLADRVAGGQLALSRLGRCSDTDALTQLMEVPGIGPWTAGIYLLMALRRADVWPPGDLALHKALGRLRGSGPPLTELEIERITAPWRPLRAVAARILWHSYLRERAAQAVEGARAVTRGNGLVARELIIDIDDRARRLVWSVVGGRMAHHNASTQVSADAPV